MCHQHQRANTSKGAKAITLLELITALKVKGRNINEGKIIVAMNNRKAYYNVIEEMLKLTRCAQDAGIEIT